MLACHAGGPGSIPGRCKLFMSYFSKKLLEAPGIDPGTSHMLYKHNLMSIVDQQHTFTNFLFILALHNKYCYQFLDSLVVRISACHVEGPGSIPGRGEHFATMLTKLLWQRVSISFLLTLTILLLQKQCWLLGGSNP